MNDDPIDITIEPYGKVDLGARHSDLVKLCNGDTISRCDCDILTETISTDDGRVLSGPQITTHLGIFISGGRVYGGRTGTVNLSFSQEGLLNGIGVYVNPFESERIEEFATYIKGLRLGFRKRYGAPDPSDDDTDDRGNGYLSWTKPGYTVDLHWECPGSITVTIGAKL